jgi:hypothetical protein
VAEPGSSSSPTARRARRAHTSPGVARMPRRPLGLFKSVATLAPRHEKP